ncbi:MAG: single-stranded DNA-binding protein [Halanaerobiales bacterium]|nr:single-stranded DNA-binding protein [Halanaerobiales bacterium]
MLNHIVLIGRLVRDPELRYTSNGTPVANFTLAVERNYRNREGERDVDYIKIVTWRKLAENVAHHLGKGRLVAVEGSLQIRKSQGKNDNRTYINPEVIANNVQFLDWPNDGKNKENNSDYTEDASQDTEEEQVDLSDDDFEVPF